MIKPLSFSLVDKFILIQSDKDNILPTTTFLTLTKI
jgi:hypothetical protein